MTSADLVAALAADPERPWATWGKGDKPLTQNQLARLLRPFAIISETVHPLGRPDAKGYKRARLEDAWAGYVPGQNTSSRPTSDSKASNRPSADETGITRDFQSVQEAPPDGLKNANLSYSHAGLDAWTFRNAESGDEEKSATTSSSGNGHAFADYPDLRLSLQRRSSVRCDHCGTLGATNGYGWPHRPFGITLHSSCEAPFYDSEGRQ
jgi:hypothetical protein